MLAHRFIGQDQEEVPPASSGSALNGVSLMFSPGNYSFGGQHWDCSQEGLYRLHKPGYGTRQFYVSPVVNGAFKPDPLKFLSGMGWIQAHGNADDALSFTQKNTKALSSKLSVSCGATVAWVRYWLDYLQIPSRQVHLLTAGTPNGYDEGHVAMEVWLDGAWRLIDQDGQRYVTYGGAILSLKDAIPCIAADEHDIVEFSGDVAYDVQPQAGYGFDVTAFCEAMWRTPEQRREWVGRIFQIPGILHTDGLIYFYMPPGTESRESWVLGLQSNHRVLTQQAWETMFYQ